jgi:hypothetical protein
MAANSQMSQPMKTMKTGTTICGIIYKVCIQTPSLFMLTKTDSLLGWRCARR